jgi:phosphoribosyl 1,2-cyclic phosphodiesterase
MHVQVLASGSQGNSLLVRAGDTTVLVDAGLPLRELDERFAAARVAPQSLDQVFVTHGHLDHARSAGALARRERTSVCCAEAVMSNASIRRSRRMAAFTVGRPMEVEGRRGKEGLALTPVLLPHDALPTVAFRIEHGGRCAVILTDIGHPCEEVARALQGAHVLVLEFNHDAAMVESGPYPASLRRRILGNAGHLSNAQAALMLRRLASSQLHTLVLAHLSQTNNTPELALESARAELEALGLSHVQVLIASQSEVGPNLAV